MHCTYSYTSVGKLQFVVSLCPDFCVWAEKREPGTVYAPINIMPHYLLYRQTAGNIGALTKGGCPYSRAFDYL